MIEKVCSLKKYYTMKELPKDKSIRDAISICISLNRWIAFEKENVIDKHDLHELVLEYTKRKNWPYTNIKSLINKLSIVLDTPLISIEEFLKEERRFFLTVNELMTRGLLRW